MSRDPISAPDVGQPAPHFVSRNQFGEPVESAQWRGAPAVVVFYPWAFTRTCTGELRALRDHHEDFRAAGARLVAVSCDTMFSLRVFAEQESLDFDLVSDHWPHGSIARAYGVFDEEAGCALRGSFVLDAAGRVSWRLVNGIGEARDIGAHLTALAAV